MVSRRAPRLPLGVHAPALGRDSRRILAELGYPQTEIARLISDGVVRAAPK